MSNSSNQSKGYIDLNATVVGTLRRVREVKVAGKGGRKAQSYWACSIKALHGDARNPDFTYLDLTIPAAEALEFVKSKASECDNNREVFVRAFVGDLRAETYERTNSRTNELENASIIKGRLLKIEATSRSEATVNGRYEATARGMAYLNMLLSPKSDKPDWVTNLAAMHGEISAMDYTPFRLTMQDGNEASDILAALQPTIAIKSTERPKVIVSFKARNIISGFFFRKSKVEGQEGVQEIVGQISGELTDITYVKIGEEVAYKLIKEGENYTVETTLELRTGTHD